MCTIESKNNIYFILFNNIVGQVMRDSQLFLVVGVLLCMDITIMTTWQLADPFYREIQNLKAFVSIHYYDYEFYTISPVFLSK